MDNFVREKIVSFMVLTRGVQKSNQKVTFEVECCDSVMTMGAYCDSEMSVTL